MGGWVILSKWSAMASFLRRREHVPRKASGQTHQRRVFQVGRAAGASPGHVPGASEDSKGASTVAGAR